jgi:DNA-binding response OmpR family regulator
MRRILAVDDNEDILEILKLILEGYDYDVMTLADGHLLIEHIKEYKPDLILLDIMLGDMDGRELCRIVKSNHETHDIPIIMISASHNLTERSKLYESPNDFLAKPFDISDLISKVQTHLSAA